MSGLSRRSFLSTAALGAVSMAVSPPVSAAFQGLTSATVDSLPSVTPLWSESVRRRYGVCAHPNFQRTVYGSLDAWASRLDTLGAAYFRGFYAPGLPSTLRMVEHCRRLGLKWLMLVVPEDWSMTSDRLKATLAHIRDNAADVCIGIEGMNEPNHNRNGTPLRADWATATVAYQRIIADFVDRTPSLSHVQVLGSALNLIVSDPVGDMKAMEAAGMSGVMDAPSLHSYPGGFVPENRLDERLGYVKQSFGAAAAWISETGYNNATNAVSGHRPVDEGVAATYAPRALLEAARRGCYSIRYELLDDPNPAKDQQEANFGLIRCPSFDPATWTPKPEFTSMRTFLSALRDDGPGCYQPKPVKLKVSAPSDVSWTVLGKSNGTFTLAAYRRTAIYNPVTRSSVTVSPTQITVTDQRGSRTHQVGADVVSFPVY